jgi:hypothetical protein
MQRESVMTTIKTKSSNHPRHLFVFLSIGVAASTLAMPAHAGFVMPRPVVNVPRPNIVVTRPIVPRPTWRPTISASRPPVIRNAAIPPNRSPYPPSGSPPSPALKSNPLPQRSVPHASPTPVAIGPQPKLDSHSIAGQMPHPEPRAMANTKTADQVAHPEPKANVCEGLRCCM